MPSRADIEAATPKCPRPVGPGTHSGGEPVMRCCTVLRQFDGGWFCPRCVCRVSYVAVTGLLLALSGQP